MFREFETGLARKDEPRVDEYANGDLAILFPLDRKGRRVTYQINLERTYRGVFNPDPELFAAYVDGSVEVTLGVHKFMIGATVNGGCPLNCIECPFAGGEAASPITAGELIASLTEARQIAISHGKLQSDESFSAGALLAGEIGYSPHAADLIVAMSEFPGCIGCRWSTTAPGNSRFDVGNAFINGALRAGESNPHHKLSFQFSIHSTDPGARAAHTGADDLIPFSKIAVISKQLKRITGRKPALAVVLHEGTVFDVDRLTEHFSPEDNILSLRRMYSPSRKQMTDERIVNLFSEARARSWDVVWMPPNKGTNGDVPHELINLRRTQPMGYSSLGLL